MPQIQSGDSHDIPSYRESGSLGWWRAPAVVALITALLLCNGTRAFDCLRAASYFLRTRRGPAVAMVRLDQHNNFTQVRFGAKLIDKHH
jgi:hypothetical protein